MYPRLSPWSWKNKHRNVCCMYDVSFTNSIQPDLCYCFYMLLQRGARSHSGKIPLCWTDQYFQTFTRTGSRVSPGRPRFFWKAWTDRQRKGRRPGPPLTLQSDTLQLRSIARKNISWRAYFTGSARGTGMNSGTCRSTSGPRRDGEEDVTFREEQQDAGGHGAKCKPVGPTVTEGADTIQRPGTQSHQKHKHGSFISWHLQLLLLLLLLLTYTTIPKRPSRNGNLRSIDSLWFLFWRNDSTPTINTWTTRNQRKDTNHWKNPLFASVQLCESGNMLEVSGELNCGVISDFGLIKGRLFDCTLWLCCAPLIGVFVRHPLKRTI